MVGLRVSFGILNAQLARRYQETEGGREADTCSRWSRLLEETAQPLRECCGILIFRILKCREDSERKKGGRGGLYIRLH